MKYRTLLTELPWKPHPTAPGVEMQPLVTSADGPDLTCVLVRVPAGSSIPEHTHETQEDIVYPLSGRATMRVAGEEFELSPGMIVRVPAGVLHGIIAVSEDLLVYDVFSPALI